MSLEDDGPAADVGAVDSNTRVEEKEPGSENCNLAEIYRWPREYGEADGVNRLLPSP